MVSSIVAPKIIFASLSAAAEIILAASSTSLIVRSGPPITLKRTPRAPSMVISKRGDAIAERAAACALFSPTPVPIPIREDPAFCIIVLTSAKSTLISPGIVIRSDIP